MALMIWSSGRRVAKTPKVCMNGMWPLRASAPATPIMFASAMPAWMNRSGISAWNRSISHERDVAAPGERPGHAHHVRLGHAGVDEPVRDLRLEQVDLALAGQVTAQAHDLGAPPRQLDQGAAA